MKAHTALVGTDGVIELYTITQIDLHFAAVVDPGHAEREDAIGLYKPFNELGTFKFRMLVVDIFNAQKHFAYGLQVFVLAGMLGLKS